MDNLAHSLVGLASAKAGLDRLSPYATTVSVVTANIADADFVTLFFGDRWTLLQHHRGITHSILGTIAIALLVPVIALAMERLVAGWRKREPRIRFRGLLIVSLLAATTHPILDLTNNYGVRPWLPWSGRWYYGDLVFIVDPYIWLLLGSVVFLITSNSKFKTIAWTALGIGVTSFIGLAGWRSGADGTPLRVAFAVWVMALLVLTVLRVKGLHRLATPGTALAALLILVVYWGGLALAHSAAMNRTLSTANAAASANGEYFVRAISMPTAATPFEWQSVAETNLAMYRFKINIRGAATEFNRYPKPAGDGAQLVSVAAQDRRAQTLLEFARFPIAKVDAANCFGQALVQFADLRYTEPGSARGNFSVNIPVDCPSR